ncbi:MAG: CocE/NonD family hydrolase [Armatimonadota bacterium]
MTKRLKISLIAVIIILIISIYLYSALSAAPTKTEMVPMRDGVKLVTDVYLPAGDGPWPTIVMRSPYPRSMNEGLTNAGYAVVIQSTRGRYGSEDANGMVFFTDGWGKAQDGYDCIGWVTKQSWCNGKIGTFGGSALGITQYRMAGANPPGLTCQHVIMAPCNLYTQCMYQNGALREEQIVKWLEANNFGSDSMKLVKEHPAYDAMWQEMDLSTRFAEVNVPIMHIAGWYDTFQQGNIDAFVGIQNGGGPNAKGKQKLIIGPYSHGGLGVFPEAKYPNPMPPLDVLGTAWSDFWLKGGSPVIDKLSTVTYYTMGAVGESRAPGNVWRVSDVWPVQSTITPFYLNEDKSLKQDKPTKRSKKIAYTFNPDDPVPTIGGNNLTIPTGPMDQRKVEDRKDVLLFTTEPLDKPLEVTGRIKARLWASSTGKDTDFTAKLTDVYPDGRSMLICDGILRARYWKSLAKPEFLTPGKAYEFEIDMWSTSIIINKGHRIRLAVSSSNSPRFDVNTNTGDPATKQTVTNTIYMGKSRPSALLLPVVGEKLEKIPSSEKSQDNDGY